MSAVVPAPIMMNKSLLKVGTDNYENAVGSAKITPNTPIGKFKGIGGGITKVAGVSDWVCTLGFPQDFSTAKSLSLYLSENHGTIKSIELTPEIGGKKATVSVLIVESEWGGDADSLASATVALEVIGQPVIAASA